MYNPLIVGRKAYGIELTEQSNFSQGGLSLAESEVAARILKAGQAVGLETQTEIAKTAKIPEGPMSLIMNGHRPLSKRNAEKLAKVLKVSARYLQEGEVSLAESAGVKAIGAFEERIRLAAELRAMAERLERPMPLSSTDEVTRRVLRVSADSERQLREQGETPQTKRGGRNK